MKALLLGFFVFFGSIVFSQATCSCGDPKVNGCEAKCGAGFVAICQGYGGSCSCACERIILEPTPEDPVPVTFRSYKIDIKECDFRNPRMPGIILKTRLIPMDSMFYISQMKNFKSLNLPHFNES